MAGQDDNKSNGNRKVTNGVTDSTDDSGEINIREEYDSLDSKLDELNTALDFLEQKNDDIHEKLKELLKSNIDMRQEFKNNGTESNSK